MDNNLGNKETMANNIKRYIDKMGISQTELAENLNLPQTTVSNWILAKSYPRMDKIEMMADFFGVSKADLVEEPASAVAIRSARLVKNFEKLSERDKAIIEGMIQSMLLS